MPAATDGWQNPLKARHPTLIDHIREHIRPIAYVFEARVIE
jgi:hypothetical protein